jgi:hypothetical protein
VNESLVPHLVESINLNSPPVSSFASDIDNLIVIVALIVMTWFFAALGLFLYFILKFRAKPGQRSMHIDGYNPQHKRWITYPHNAVLVFDVVILVLALCLHLGGVRHLRFGRCGRCRDRRCFFDCNPPPRIYQLCFAANQVQTDGR